MIVCIFTSDTNVASGIVAGQGRYMCRSFPRLRFIRKVSCID